MEMIVLFHLIKPVIFSLVFNELISNSIVHGLDGTDGVISLSVSSMNDAIALVFTDSGKRFAS